MTTDGPFGGGMRKDIQHFFGSPGAVDRGNRERRGDVLERDSSHSKRRSIAREWPVRIGDPPLFETIVVARSPEEAIQRASVAVEWRRVGSIDSDDLDLG